MNSTLTGPVAIYLAQVRAELSDLPAGELEDVLEDVSGHLTEVAGEFEAEPTTAALEERLGTPREYAAELRTAAGYPPRTQPVAARDAARNALRWGLVAAVAGPFFVALGIFYWSREGTLFLGVLGFAVLFGAAFLGVRALRDNDPRIVLETPRGRRGAEVIQNLVEQIPPNVRGELVTIGQPVWWVARGAIGGGGFFALFGAGAVTVVGAIAGAAVSIWIGRRTQQDRRWLWYVVPLNVVAAVAVPAFLAAAYMGASFGFTNDYRDFGRRPAPYVPDDGLVLNGAPISNIYPFDAAGKQVSVRLYDQDGNPIALRLEDCATAYGQTDPGTTSNVFPHRVVTADENGMYEGNCLDSDKAPFVPPPAPATTTPTPAGTPAASASPSTTPRPSATLTVQPSR